MSQITEKVIADIIEKMIDTRPMVDAAPSVVRRLQSESIARAVSAAIASLSHTMGEKGEECHCTKIEQDETCPIGYPSLLCEDCDGKGIRSALTPTQQPVRKVGVIVEKGRIGKAVIAAALASPQAVPGWEMAIEIIEARIPIYTDIGQINALRECISSIKHAALNAEVSK